ncbi:MAG: SMP-30/gluconolactonase/LRE family protein [Polaribacter sp.]|uniref:SMP-30/gluconolactonase/LRE family protein n=1 Tax=Polaribacter sp. TaxID=1920175 RepID=UPI003BB054C7
MKFKKRIFYAILILLVLFVANIFISTGYFRTIENKFNGKILKKINIAGAEDITISRKDSFAIVSSTIRNKFPNTKQEIGGLYFIDLKNNNFSPILLTKDFKKPFAPHGISIYQKDNKTTIAAINHTLQGEFIEIFTLVDTLLTHQKTLKNKLIFSPNDLVLLDENRFYFTNDHKYKDGIGRLSEDYLGLSISNVIYFDGENYTEVADGIAYSNGINFDTNRNLIFVASPRKFLVKVYQKNKDNSLTFIENIDCKTGVDNIEFDKNNNLWVGAHPNLLHFAAYAKGDKETSPSEIIKINYIKKGDYSIEQVYLENGEKMSGSTVAAPFGNLILSGNVMDSHFLILKPNSN